VVILLKLTHVKTMIPANLFKRSLAALCCISATLCAPAAMADMVTFDVTWAAVGYNGYLTGGPQWATAEFTMDTAYLASGSVSMDKIASLTVTVGGAGAGNGTFGKYDFSSMSFSYNHPLNYSGQLIGQFVWSGNFNDHTGPFGGAIGGGGQDGDFNLTTRNDGIVGAPAAAPSAVQPFMMVTNGNPSSAIPGSPEVDHLFLGVTSIIARPAGASPLGASVVPEPGVYAMLLAGIGLIGCMARRKP
jgi:hypothetical protein